MTVKVKICGIRTLDTAQKAVSAGANYLGFNFVATSPRYISPKTSAAIIAKVKGRVYTVGVFQNAPTDMVNHLASQLKLDFVQLHGNETRAYIENVTTPVIKAITADDDPQKYTDVHYFLLDRPGKKGNPVDQQIASDIAKEFPLFLAGGLTPGNVASAIAVVHPFAVDVASGVETDGGTNPDKVTTFINQAKKTSL